ncbi:hypothetical protein DL96DRAFT_1677971 [Flagelloscypha sp. PMI_526]|nr:hypothetical protein DL96DRAFT_1677971 [Flagelloscypha sp. PMI_526]
MASPFVNDRYRGPVIASTVPTEVLEIILIIYRDLVFAEELPYYPDYEEYVQPSRPAIPWLPPSHVCTPWRRAAVNCAFLWDTINLNNVEATKQMILRSRQVPLFVGRAGQYPLSNRSSRVVYQSLLEILPH